MPGPCLSPSLVVWRALEDQMLGRLLSAVAVVTGGRVPASNAVQVSRQQRRMYNSSLDLDVSVSRPSHLGLGLKGLGVSSPVSDSFVSSNHDVLRIFTPCYNANKYPPCF